MANRQKAYMKIYGKTYYIAHKEETKARSRARNKSHKEEIAAKNKIYRKIHKEEIAIVDKAYNDSHKEQKKAYYKLHKEEIAVQKKAYYKLHQRKCKQRQLKRDHNLDLSDYDNMVICQNNCCAICGKKMKRPNVDHDHITGKIRGLLCNQCNQGLGLFQDNPDFLIEAASYIGRNLDKTMQGVTWRL